MTESTIKAFEQNQSLLERSHELLSMASVQTVFACKADDGEPQWENVDIHRAIQCAEDALSILYGVRSQIRPQGATNGVVELDSPDLVAEESPTIRSLPVSDSIKALSWLSGPLPEMQRTH